jgi:ParB-like nuclease domain
MNNNNLNNQEQTLHSILQFHQEVFGVNESADYGVAEFQNYIANNRDTIPTLDSVGQWDIVMMANNDNPNDRSSDRDNNRDNMFNRDRDNYNDSRYINGASEFPYTPNSADIRDVRAAGWDFGVLGSRKNTPLERQQEILLRELSKLHSKDSERYTIEQRLEKIQQDLFAQEYYKLLNEPQTKAEREERYQKNKSSQESRLEAARLRQIKQREQRERSEAIKSKLKQEYKEAREKTLKEYKESKAKREKEREREKEERYKRIRNRGKTQAQIDAEVRAERIRNQRESSSQQDHLGELVKDIVSPEQVVAEFNDKILNQNDKLEINLTQDVLSNLTELSKKNPTELTKEVSMSIIIEVAKKIGLNEKQIKDLADLKDIAGLVSAITSGEPTSIIFSSIQVTPIVVARLTEYVQHQQNYDKIATLSEQSARKHPGFSSADYREVTQNQSRDQKMKLLGYAQKEFWKTKTADLSSSTNRLSLDKLTELIESNNEHYAKIKSIDTSDISPDWQHMISIEISNAQKYQERLQESVNELYKIMRELAREEERKVEEKKQEINLEQARLEKVGKTEWVNLNEVVIVTQLDTDNPIRLKTVDEIQKDFLESGYSPNKEKAPILVYQMPDGRLLLSDGHHRYYAAKKAKLHNLPIKYMSKKEYDAKGWSISSDPSPPNWPPYQKPQY